MVLATCLCGTLCLAEFEVVSVTTAPFVRSSYNGPPEIIMNLQIRNISEKNIFVWGQDFGTQTNYYLIESFIQNSDNAVWERDNSGMCGSVGRIGWIGIQPGETIRQGNVIFQKYVGQQMILTLRRAYSDGDAKGAEILLGPFRIPEPNESEQSGAGYPPQSVGSPDP